MKQHHVYISVALIALGLSSNALARKKGGQTEENACLDQYNNCYNNCAGKPDVCYSNCDTVYLHCLRGVGTINATAAQAKLKQHPVTGEATPVATGGTATGVNKVGTQVGTKMGTVKSATGEKSAMDEKSETATWANGATPTPEATSKPRKKSGKGTDSGTDEKSSSDENSDNARSAKKATPTPESTPKSKKKADTYNTYRPDNNNHHNHTN